MNTKGLYRFGPPRSVIPYVLFVAVCINAYAHDYNDCNCVDEALERGGP